MLEQDRERGKVTCTIMWGGWDLCAWRVVLMADRSTAPCRKQRLIQARLLTKQELENYRLEQPVERIQDHFEERLIDAVSQIHRKNLFSQCQEAQEFEENFFCAIFEEGSCP